ncbi:MAG TPA: (d)CMP kinase [Nitrospiraceae bacterium]|nr:MAG: cytidylate kinase [Nitrospirae bacterium GWA2_46_11]OGW22816.1 MAG: cytidylate kinase [Nitrospirae bacterium GWB2_47_37]HAK89831.1 (d)CMP kinase [Nitrospiraceae bacterium]HCZ10969.1 (d)CMP kinase [Nitrospiraceae bacterium]
MGKVIAIDGPSGAGKSTVSKLIAERLGFEFLDTGALYRAAALHLKRMNMREESPDADISRALHGVVINFKNGRVFLNDEDVSDAIRTTEAGHYASVFSAKKAVRDFLLQTQRDAAVHNDIVAEGRDMTTVVFPDAWKKFFLDASEQGRAKRRYLQLKEKGMKITMEEASADVRERDKRDSSRDIAPLKKADDAVCIDTTDLSLNEVIEEVLKAVNKTQ